jgi:hypothetical protein
MMIEKEVDVEHEPELLRRGLFTRKPQVVRLTGSVTTLQTDLTSTATASGNLNDNLKMSKFSATSPSHRCELLSTSSTNLTHPCNRACWAPKQ